MSSYSIAHWADFCGLHSPIPLPENVLFEHLFIDTREIVDGSNGVFFCLQGRRDGHDFIQDAIDKGVLAIVVQQDYCVNEAIPNDLYVLHCPDVLTALQQTALMHRKKLVNTRFIGITGSNGKTIVKEWAYQLIESEKRTYRSFRSHNSQIGVALSVWKVRPEDAIAVIEAGISAIGEMEKLAAMIQPEIVVLSHIGDAHDAGFPSRKLKIREKLSLAQNHARTICLPAHVQEVVDFVESAEAKEIIEGKELCFWNAKKSEQSGLNQEILQVISSRFNTLAMQSNAMAAAVTALCCGIPPKTVQVALGGVKPIPLRLEVLYGDNQSILLNDTWSNDKESLKLALEFLSQFDQRKHGIILSELSTNSAEDDESWFSLVFDYLKNQPVSFFIGVGSKWQKAIASHTIPCPHQTVESTDDLAEAIDRFDRSHTTILIKGSRAFGLDAIFPHLMQRAHPSFLEVSLSQITSNLSAYRQRAPKSKIMVMVKALAYGSGSIEVARHVSALGVDYLAVAYTNEGIVLREAGIKSPIMVMNADFTAIDLLTEHRLEPVLFSQESLQQWVKASRLSNHLPCVHIEWDSGMKRLGFPIEDAISIAKQIKKHNIKVASTFSHLVSSNNAQHDGFTQEQIKAFSACAQQLEQTIGRPVIKHLVNSSGILRFPSAHFDMVRLGLGLYGYSQPSVSEIQPVLTWISQISQIHHVRKGESIGYDRAFIAERDMKIATIPLGYADGLSTLWAGGYMMVNLHKAKILGKICMDLTMIDVTNIPATTVGSAVIILGNGLLAKEMALHTGQSVYEIISTISSRIPRKYIS